MKFAPRTRGEARLAIETAAAGLRILATADQIADLADAKTAFKHKDYGVAVALAHAALVTAPPITCDDAPDARTRDGLQKEFSVPDRFTLGAPCPARVPGREIYATARFLILQHGPWAGTIAAGRTDAFFDEGDRQSAAVWLRIFNAVAVLVDGKRCGRTRRA